MNLLWESKRIFIYGGECGIGYVFDLLGVLELVLAEEVDVPVLVVETAVESFELLGHHGALLLELDVLEVVVLAGGFLLDHLDELLLVPLLGLELGLQLLEGQLVLGDQLPRRILDGVQYLFSSLKVSFISLICWKIWSSCSFSWSFSTAE